MQNAARISFAGPSFPPGTYRRNNTRHGLHGGVRGAGDRAGNCGQPGSSTLDVSRSQRSVQSLRSQGEGDDERNVCWSLLGAMPFRDARRRPAAGQQCGDARLRCTWGPSPPRAVPPGGNACPPRAQGAATAPVFSQHGQGQASESHLSNLHLCLRTLHLELGRKEQ